MFRKVLLSLGLVLLGCVASFGQSTTVSGQVTDSGAQTWNNGTYTFTFVPSGNNPVGPYTWTGGTLNTTITGSLTSTGSYSVSIPSNTAISPVNSVWSARFCPQASSACFAVNNITVTGGTQTVNATPPTILISLQTAVPPVLAYSTSEITGAAIGSQFYLLGAGVQVCQAVSGNNCTTWGSSGGAIPSTPPTLPSAQGPRFNVVNYGAVGDAQFVANGVTTGGGATVSSTTAPFVAGDLNKKLYCYQPTNGAAEFSPSIVTITQVNSASLVTTNGTDQGASGSLNCVWYTKDSTAAFQAAFNAALGSISTSNTPNAGPTIGTMPGTVYIPEGGYVLSNWAYQFVGSGSSQAPSIIGDGRQSSILYLAPTFPTSTSVVIAFSSKGAVIRDFSVTATKGTANLSQPAVALTSSQEFLIENVGIYQISSNGLGSNGVGTLSFQGASNGIARNVFVQGGVQNNSDFACDFSNASILAENLTCSNHFQTAKFVGGSRSVAGSSSTIVYGIFDECSATADCTILVGGSANFIGTTFFNGASGHVAMNIDGTSSVWCSDCNLGVFGSTNITASALSIASGGIFYTTGSTIRGNGAATAAVTGPAGATFADLGGNQIQNCVSAVCTNVTATNYTTLGFSGGIVPKATVTHTPNTCYAVTGNLLATAQNICTILLDQNYQVLNVTAQSGGTTPTNSSCTGAPVITMSDGTRSATLTMTTGKTAWTSAVDAQTNIPGQVFASGATLTVSIGANTCATAPVNVSVNYVLQSVLNP